MCLKPLCFTTFMGATRLEMLVKKHDCIENIVKYLRIPTRNHCNHPAFVSVVAAVVGLRLLGLTCQGATSVLRVVAWVVAHKSS